MTAHLTEEELTERLAEVESYEAEYGATWQGRALREIAEWRARQRARDDGAGVVPRGGAPPGRYADLFARLWGSGRDIFAGVPRDASGVPDPCVEPEPEETDS